MARYLFPYFYFDPCFPFCIYIELLYFYYYRMRALVTLMLTLGAMECKYMKSYHSYIIDRICAKTKLTTGKSLNILMHILCISISFEFLICIATLYSTYCKETYIFLNLMDLSKIKKFSWINSQG